MHCSQGVATCCLLLRSVLGQDDQECGPAGAASAVEPYVFLLVLLYDDSLGMLKSYRSLLSWAQYVCHTAAWGWLC